MNPGVRPAVTRTDWVACLEIRYRVFVEEQRVPPDEELDDLDEVAAHYLYWTEFGQPVGTARLVDRGDGMGKVGRVAVLADYRGQGVGAALMRAVRSDAEGRFDTLLLDAQVHVIPFYERLGYVAEGDVFPDAGIPHRRMRLRLAL